MQALAFMFFLFLYLVLAQKILEYNQIMTLVLASIFDDGKLVLSDSRASAGTTSEDVLQKIVGINKDIIVGYAGGVAAVNRVLTAFQTRIVDENLNAPDTITVLQEESVAEFANNNEGFSLLLFTKANRAWTINRLQSSDFEPEEIEDIALIGSGSVISPQIVPFYETIKDETEPLKSKADRIIWHISSLLASSGAQGVGGMIQALLLLPDGVQTMHTGFIDMNPEGEHDSKEIKFENGRWVQYNHRDNSESVIIAPNELLQQPVHERVFHSYEKATGGQPSKWYINSFLTAQDIKLDHHEASFTNMFNAAGAEEFPHIFEIWVYLSFWGPSTEHSLELVHVDPNGSQHSLYSGTFDNKDFPLEYEFLEKLPFNINMAGKHYLECLIDGELAGHKMIFITSATPILPSAANAFNSLNAHQNAVDERLVGSELTYFFVGNERGEQEPMSMKIKGQFRVAYTTTYPLNMHGYANFGVRSSPGEHEFEVQVMNAATHEIISSSKSTLECSSTTFTKPCEVKFDLIFPQKGFYFVLVRIDSELKGCTVLMADGVPPMTYSLPEHDLDGIRNGGLHLLAKRALQQN
jgi:hypothetical protein